MLRTPVLRLLLFLGVLAGGCGGGVGDGPPVWDTPPGTSMTEGERAMALRVFDLLNEARASVEAPPLVWDERASDAAYDHCVDMRLRNFYDHVNPDGDGPCDRLLAKQIAMTSCGAENIARSNPSPEDLMDALLASAPHRETMLSTAHTHVGIGVHTGAGGPWWVQDFFVAEAR